MNRILLIEDEEVILKALTRLLERNHFDVTTAVTVEEAIEAQPQSFDLVLADLRLPGAEGTAIIPVADPVPVVIMTSHASVRSAVTAMRAGAIDYIAKPFDHDELLLIIERSLMQNRLRAQNQSLKQDLRRLVPEENLKQCRSMDALLKQLQETDDNIRFLALYGEHGTGKELLARVMHKNSVRHDAPFVVADLAAIDPDRMHVSLLGGAVPKPDETFLPGGLLHSAHNGTLVLRHPSYLSLDNQNALHEALDTQGLPGSSGLRAINVRTVLISDLTLDEQIANGDLSSDLASLFADQEYKVPALRDMQEDIAVLANHFLKYFKQHHNRANKVFSDTAIAAMKAYSWSGNTDELKSVIERAILISNDNQITSADLSLSSLNQDDQADDLSLDEYFRYFVLRHQGKLSETELAAKLGISRKALWERRQKMNLTRD